MAISGTGGEALCSAMAGLWFEVKLKEKRPEPPKPLDVREEQQPDAWVHERFQDGVWQVRIGSDWSDFPPMVNTEVEAAFKSNVREVALKPGAFGAHRHKVDLVKKIVKNEDTKVEFYVRRVVS
jgi:hypothetical protein